MISALAKVLAAGGLTGDVDVCSWRACQSWFKASTAIMPRNSWRPLSNFASCFP